MAIGWKMKTLRWFSLKPFPWLLIALTTSSCISARIAALEERLETEVAEHEALAIRTDDQSLRSESVAKGLEKISERLNRAWPPNAQWLKLARGATIKWYLDQDINNVYVQFLEMDNAAAGVLISVTNGEKRAAHLIRPGEAVELLPSHSEGSRGLMICYHQQLKRADGSAYGLFSVLEPPPRLP